MIANNCKVSIIVPVYNVETYLDRCVRSLINQELSDIEIILVNDGSTDSSGLLCEKWAERDTRIKVLNKENGGLSSARNYGIQYAKGDYVGFVDSDDYISPDMFRRLADLVQSHNADVGCCSSITFFSDEDLKNMKDRASAAYDMDKFEFYQSCISCRDGNGVGVCNKLFRRDIFNKVYFKEGIYVEDYYSFPDIVANVERAVMDAFVGYYYYQRPDGITRGFYHDPEKHIHDRILGCRHNMEVLLKAGFSKDIIYMANAPRQLAICRIAGLCGAGKYKKDVKLIANKLRKQAFKIISSKFITFGVKKSYFVWLICPWAYYGAYDITRRGRR